MRESDHRPETVCNTSVVADVLVQVSRNLVGKSNATVMRLSNTTMKTAHVCHLSH